MLPKAIYRDAAQVAAFVIRPLRWLMDFCVWTWRYLRCAWMSLSHPGPMSMPIFGIAFQLDPSPTGAVKYFLDLWAKFGSWIWAFAGPQLLVFSSDLRDVESVLSSSRLLTKAFFYTLLRPWLGEGLLVASGDKWRARRKALTPAFHFKLLDHFLPAMNANSDVFVEQLRELRKRSDGRPVDVFPPVSLLALDVIAETAMGVKINAQTDFKSPYVHAINEFAHTMLARMLRPWLYPYFIFSLSSVGRRQKAAVKVLHDTTNRMIRERKSELLRLKASGLDPSVAVDSEGRKRRLAFLDLLLMEQGNSGLTDKDIREEVDTFTFEGFDTTATAIAFTLYLLSRHPDVQEKVVEELKTVFGNKLSIPERAAGVRKGTETQCATPTHSEMASLVYLEMVIKESLRIYPPVPVLARCVHEDFLMPSRGKVAPRQSDIVVAPWANHRDPDVFPAPETFDPERFRPEQVRSRHPFAYIPFSAGPRNCIGQKFAMLELKCAVAKALWNFRLLPVKGFEPVISFEMVLKTKNGLLVRLEERRTPST